jgi:hypothetical protein
MIDKYMKINLIDEDIKDEIKEILHKSTNCVHEIELKKYEIKRLEISNIFLRISSKNGFTSSCQPKKVLARCCTYCLNILLFEI